MEEKKKEDLALTFQYKKSSKHDDFEEKQSKNLNNLSLNDEKKTVNKVFYLHKICHFFI